MKKIGIYLNFEPSGGGTFQYATSILEAVLSIKNQGEVVVFFTDQLWIERLKKYNVRSIYLKRNFSWRVFWYLWRKFKFSINFWRKYVSRLNPQSKKIYSEECDLCIFPSQDISAVEFDVPSLVSVHDLMHLYESRFSEVSDKGEFKRREFTYKNICRFAQGILVDSNIGKEQLINSYGVSSAKVFPLPFIPPQYILEHKIFPRTELPFHLPEKYVFYPAQFWKHKNHLNLLSAIKLLKEKATEINIVFCGSEKNGSQELAYYISKNALEKNVTFLSYVDDVYMASIYHYSKGLIFPTFFGPTNIPPLEAVWLGKPMAVSNVYGMPEQLGDSSLWFDPNSPSEIATAVEKIWTDNYDQELLAETREKIKLKITENKLSKNLEDILKKLKII